MGMALSRSTKVSFSPAFWDVLEKEAALAGSSVAEYIREATMARAFIAVGHRGGTAPALYAKLLAVAREFAHEYWHKDPDVAPPDA